MLRRTELSDNINPEQRTGTPRKLLRYCDTYHYFLGGTFLSVSAINSPPKNIIVPVLGE